MVSPTIHDRPDSGQARTRHSLRHSRAEAMIVAAEHCAWWLENGVTAHEAMQILGLRSNKRHLSWRDVQPHVAKRWLSLRGHGGIE